MKNDIILIKKILSITLESAPLDINTFTISLELFFTAL